MGGTDRLLQRKFWFPALRARRRGALWCLAPVSLHLEEDSWNGEKHREKWLSGFAFGKNQFKETFPVCLEPELLLEISKFPLLLPKQ